MMPSGPRTARMAAVVAVAATLAHALLYLGWMLDDAYISFRYARHLASGDGMVFNVGERVEGYTNFLWVILCALGIRLGAAPELVAPLLSLASLVALSLSARAGARWLSSRSGEASPSAGVAAMALVAATQSLALYGSNGLETVLFALWSALAAWSMVARWPLRFAAFTTLAFLTRPEAGLVGGIGAGLFALDALRDRSRRGSFLKVALALSAGVLPYLAWKVSWFGALLPNTFHAKPGDAAVGVRYVLIGAAPLLAALALSLRDAAATRDAPDARAPRELLGLGLVMMAAVAVEGGDWMPAFRLLAAPTAVLAMAFDATLSRAFEKGGGARALALGALALCVVWNGLRTREDLQVVPVVARHEAQLVAIASALRQVGVRSVALTDIGRVGWILDRADVLDLGGLTDATIARTPGPLLSKRVPAAYLARRDPEVLLLNSRLPVRALPGASLPAVAPMWKVERSVLETPWFQSRARYACSMMVSEAHFIHVFERADLPPRVAGSTPLCAPLVAR